jgi:hypothetical protein
VRLVSEGPDLRALTNVWINDVPAIAQDMYGAIANRIPGAGSDPDLAALTLASCSSNIESILSMLQSGIPASAAEAPVTALEHARLMAKRGAEVDDTLRFYRLGLGYFLRRATDDLRAVIPDPEQLLEAVEAVTGYAVEYTDIVSSRVSAEHLAERERRQRRAAVVRAELVRALLAGEPHDPAAAARTLGHALDRAQLAFVCWSATAPGRLEAAALAVAGALGASRPLLVPEGSDALAGWVVPGPGAAEGIAGLGEVLAATAPEVAVAVGEAGTGLDGFRTSHDEAQRARRVAGLLGRDAGPCTAFADVALLDLLTADLAAARRFVRTRLGGLAEPDPAVAAVRETLRIVLAPRGGIARAAREQDLHRNTVLQRVHRAEALLGGSLDDRPDELHLALVLAGELPQLLED